MSTANKNRLSIPLVIGNCLVEDETKTYQTTLYLSANDLPNSWNEFAKHYAPLFASNIISVAEQSNIEGLENFYIETKKADKTIALFFFQSITLDKGKLPDFSSLSTTSKAFYKILSCGTYNLLVSGHVFFNDFPSTAIHPSEKNNLNVHDVFEKSLLKIYRLTKSCGVIIKNPVTEIQNYLASKPSKYRLLPEDVVMNIEVPTSWITIDDYIGTLSKKYATRSKKLIESTQQFIIKEFDEQDMAATSATWFPLYMNVIKKSSFKVGVLNAAFFIELKKQLGQNFIFKGWFIDDKLCGFTTAIIKENEMELYYIGVDYQTNKSHHLYHCFLQQAIADAIEKKINLLKLGRTAYEAKAIAGAKPEVLYNYMQIRNPLIKIALNYASEMFQKENDTQWQKRNPFK